MGLDRILSRGAKLYPRKTAVIDDSGIRYTYQELNQRVNQLCSALRKEGLSEGERVAFLSRNCAEYFTVSFACARMGSIFVPLNFMFSAEEIIYVINNSEPSTLILDHPFYQTIQELRERFPSVSNYICMGSKPDDMVNYEDLLASSKPELPNEEIDGSLLSHIIYTSGSTGKPKGVMLTHDNFLSMINTFAIEAGITKDDILLRSSPQFHVGGVAYQFMFLYVGGTAVVGKTFDPKLTFELLEKEKVTFIIVVPTVLFRLISYPEFNKYDLSFLRIINLGASPMLFDKFKLAYKLLNVDFLHTYGQTETSCLLTFNYMKKEELALLNSDEKLRKRVLSCGREGINIEVRVVDQGGKDVNPGSVGEIIARGPNIMKGYWRLEEETEKVLRDGWLYTGDMGTVDEEGNIFIMDRKKDMIISGGENIYSAEVENAISSHPAVQEVAVVGVPDDIWVESVKAIVILKEGMRATEEEIIDYCKKSLASYKKPKSVEFWKELPKNSLGKVTKNVIREKYWGKKTLQEI